MRPSSQRWPGIPGRLPRYREGGPRQFGRTRNRSFWDRYPGHQHRWQLPCRYQDDNQSKHRRRRYPRRQQQQQQRVQQQAQHRLRLPHRQLDRHKQHRRLWRWSHHYPDHRTESETTLQYNISGRTQRRRLPLRQPTPAVAHRPHIRQQRQVK